MPTCSKIAFVGRKLYSERPSFLFSRHLLVATRTESACHVLIDKHKDTITLELSIKDLEITGASPRILRDKSASPYAMTHAFYCSLFFVPVIRATPFSMDEEIELHLQSEVGHTLDLVHAGFLVL